MTPLTIFTIVAVIYLGWNLKKISKEIEDIKEKIGIDENPFDEN